MKKFFILLSIPFLLLGCAKNKTFSIQNESSSKTAKVDNKEVDNNIEKYKYQLEDKLYLISLEIMEDEEDISKAPSYKRMLRFIGYIKKKLEKSFSIIEEYSQKSSNAEYQRHIKYVECTYKAINSSYLYMESFIQSEMENQYIKRLDIFKEKLRANTSSVFIKDMEKCEKIK